MLNTLAQSDRFITEKKIYRTRNLATGKFDDIDHKHPDSEIQTCDVRGFTMMITPFCIHLER
ncbi:hypothetical protein Pst134EA_018924 [Puccinia striiformis f. sp. tritici]|uniref:hypothetical protein n=1 Tax=Puccinia striiformis f. sp. tritici TaxID=168172 RepID=UPI0020073D2C|nr:hypothetical protein Pst134EA_018924 [Puccinia striiformis f. sp. tritici]KAH9458768.1 hypothetical protein Pst134EA_018924 [Puccinia striiformis f. sp. tritici]